MLIIYRGKILHQKHYIYHISQIQDAASIIFPTPNVACIGIGLILKDGLYVFKMGSGMSSMSKMGKGISKKGLKSISTMKMKMKEIRYKMKEKKRLKKLKKKKKNKKKKGELGEDNEEDEEEEDEDDTSSMNSSTLGSIGSPNGSVDGSYSETKSSTSSQNSASTSTSPIDMPNFRRKLNKGPVCNWEVERFSFKIDKINSLKGTPLPKRVIKMLLNSILPKAIENAIKGALNEAFGIYLSETPGQRCLLAGEITLSGTGLDVFDSTVGKHNDIIFFICSDTPPLLV